MGKQINSARKMDRSSRNTNHSNDINSSGNPGQTKSFVNKKRIRDIIEKSQEDETLSKLNHHPSPLEVNNIYIIPNEKFPDIKAKKSFSKRRMINKNLEIIQIDLCKENEPEKLKNLNLIITDLTLDENNNKYQKYKKENSNICSICRVGGELLLCDKCPKSFHMTCLKLNKNSILPDTEWFCAACIPVVERQKLREVESEQRRKVRNEKKKLWRLKKKEELKSKSIEKLNCIPLINGEFVEKLFHEKNRFENKFQSVNKYKIKSKLKSLSNNKHKKNFMPHGHQYTNGFGNLKELPQKNSSKSNNGSVICLDDTESKEKLNLFHDNKNSGKFPELIQISIGDFLNNSNSNSKNISASKDIGLGGSNNNMNNIKNSDFTNIISENNLNFGNLIGNKNKFNKNLIKYPIDDIELYSNSEKYNLSENYFNKPKGLKSIIPDKHFTKIIKIWDLFDSFKNKFNITYFFPEELYIALNYQGEKELRIITEIHLSLIKIFHEEICLKELNDFIFDKNLLIFRIAFNNIKSADSQNFIWLEIVRLLINSGFYNLMVTEVLKNLAEKLNLVKYNEYNKQFDIEEKLLILEFLTMSTFETESFRNIIKTEIEKKKQLKSEINNMDLELKAYDSRKRELERQEKFTQPKLKIESLTKRLENLVEENPNLTRMELTKLRKELEVEREQFKSVIKESENLEVNKLKLVSKKEKIELELFNLGTIHKKLLGTDGLKNEYYFHNSMPNKILIKKSIIKIPEFDNEEEKKNYEWSELNSEDDINNLLNTLSEKGIKETNLAYKISKIKNKKLKFSNFPLQENKNNTPEEILNNLLSQENFDSENSSKKMEIEADPEKIILCEILEKLDMDITEYLTQDKKEWESIDIRGDWKAFVNCTDSSEELGKSLIFLNQKFKNPYKQNEFKNKVISDEDLYRKNIFIDVDRKLNLEYASTIKISAAKVKVWSLDHVNIDLEENFIYFLENVKSLKSIILASLFYDGIINDLIKKRDYYKNNSKKKENYSENILPINNNSNINNNNYNNSNSDYFSTDGYKESKSNIKAAESKKEKVSLNNKKIITDYDDEIYYDDEEEEEFEIPQKITNEKIEKYRETSSSNSMLRESARRSGRNVNNINNNVPTITLKTKWDTECYVCEDVGGRMIWCDSCTSVAHLECVKLTKEPDKWNCEDCLSKLVTRRMTRSCNKL